MTLLYKPRKRGGRPPSLNIAGFTGKDFREHKAYLLGLTVICDISKCYAINYLLITKGHTRKYHEIGASSLQTIYSSYLLFPSERDKFEALMTNVLQGNFDVDVPDWVIDFYNNNKEEDMPIKAREPFYQVHELLKPLLKYQSQNPTG